ncbi:MAG: YbbC/YhhH family protein [Lentimicrobiaceae bacterium]|nr:YbbC/YhhH family protein [Lentimicrobiaceae bacterium]
MKIIIFILLWVCCFAVFGQFGKDSLNLDRKNAENALELALSDKEQHNVIDLERVIVKDSLTATVIAETVLFDIYGESNIVKQKPYKIYHINNYWVLRGTLPKNMTGGTFLIIIDDRNSQVVKITHGK